MIGLLPVEYWNYSLIDVLRGWVAALDPRQGETLDMQGLGACIPVRSARAGLVAALQALDLAPRSRIAVPLYCCPVVFKAVEAAGHVPRFIDVDPDTYCMSAHDLKVKQGEVDAVIAVHMFGNPCDMPRLQEAAGGRPVIEDCAQSLGSRLNGLPAGSFGALSVFSFRSGKYLSVGEGGAVYAKDPEVRRRVARLIGSLPSPNWIDEINHVSRTYVRSMLRNRTFWGAAGRHIWAFYNRTVDYGSKSPLVLSRMYRSDLALTRRRLEGLGRAIELQRANADYYSAWLKLDNGMICDRRLWSDPNRYLYPIRLHSTEERNFLAAYLRSRNVDTSMPYQDSAEIAARYYGYQGDCPVAEQVAKRVLVLPVHHALGAKARRRIVEAVNDGWSLLADRNTAKRSGDAEHAAACAAR